MLRTLQVALALIETGLQAPVGVQVIEAEQL